MRWSVFLGKRDREEVERKEKWEYYAAALLAELRSHRIERDKRVLSSEHFITFSIDDDDKSKQAEKVPEWQKSLFTWTAVLGPMATEIERSQNAGR